MMRIGAASALVIALLSTTRLVDAGSYRQGDRDYPAHMEGGPR